ncbi:nuclear transport factor 2 family protein [Thalassobius sp. MITS945101]|uniref:nuclear transport factor 2 family protein n=1 Tax=Thalassobius sp. MITS945101 TaxID=3096994 RepID=UPI0039997464
MNRRQAIIASAAAAAGASIASVALAGNEDESQASLDTVMALMGAMGSGDMEAMGILMADDMVWMNEGDPNIPWIGPWEGKEAIIGFLGVFSQNFQTTKWVNTDVLASGDTVAIFGDMNGITTKSGKEIGEFTFALRAKVRNGQVVLWNWFEDSYAVSQAYNG